MRYIFYLIGIVILDYLTLSYLAEYEMKYFVVLHGGIWVLGGIIWSMMYLFQKKTEYLGLIVTAGLLIKMGIMFALFIVLYNKLGLSQTQILNYLIVYSIYTLVYTLYFIKKVNHK